MSFSTIGTGSGGGGAAQQVNYSITVTSSQTISALYLANSLVDVAGLLVAIQNTSGTAVTLTAAAGAIVNTASYPVNSTTTTVVIQPNATIVLETNLANLDYYIVSYSNTTNIQGGSSGQLLWQSSPNVTSFVSTGAAGYMLVSGGTTTPTWQPIAVPNVQGGFAGEILYQTATNATGFVIPGSTGQFLLSNGTSAPTWGSIAAGTGVRLVTSAGTSTISSNRSYTISCSGMTSGQSFVTYLANAGYVDADGMQYTIYNNTASVFTLVLPVINNYASYNYGNGYFISGSNVYLQPNCSVNVQTYIQASSNYTVMDVSQSQSWGFNAQISSQGSLPASTDTLMNFSAVNDPTGGFNNSSHTYVVPKKGIWFFAAQTEFQPSGTAYNANIQIRQNGTNNSIGWTTNNSNTSSVNNNLRTGAAMFCNVGDSITVTNYISAGGITVATGITTNFSGMLCK